MPNLFEQQTESLKEQSPRLGLLSRWPNVVEALKQNRVLESLAFEIKISPEIFTSPEMIMALDRHLQTKLDSFNAALKDMELETLTERDVENPFTLALRLTQLAPTLIEKEQRAHEEDVRPEQEKINEVISGVSEQFQFHGLDNLVADARITGQPESYRQEGGASSEEPELSDQLQAAARKKVLVDMYVQGKSLNQLGHMYAYYAGTEPKQHASYRALADCLHLLNAATVLLMSEQRGGVLAGMPNTQMESSAMRLGRVELRKNERGQFQMHSWGMTAAEFSHEISKGLLEYVTLDTSLPEAGTISKKEAEQLKSYLERPAIEMLELVYGAPLAKAVDQSINNWLTEIRSQHASVRGNAVSRLAKTLRVSEQDVLSGKRDRNLSLRLFKIISNLPEEKLTKFYQSALKGKLPVDYWKQIQTIDI